MKLARMFSAAAGFVLAAAAGCGGDARYAKVSGVVTFNGQPYKNAVVTFQPVAGKDNLNPGRGSSGVADDSGRFTLRTDDGHDGAVVGKHLVRIWTKFDGGAAKIDPNLGSPDGDPKANTKADVEPLPREWNATSTKQFEVPAGGTDRANFDIVKKK